MGHADRLRWQLIAALAVAAVITGIGNLTHRPLVGWVGFVVFGVAVVMYARWRRAALAERRASVFAREAKTDETRTGPDQ